MQIVRDWAVKHAGALEKVYTIFEPVLVFLHPLWKKIGYTKVEAPMRFVERNLKGLLFDCKMCGQCALSATGMSCPMNCPKNLRNGPCGGVRLNGHCEVEPDMKCVWAQAYEGSQRMRLGSSIQQVQYPVDFSLEGSSSWMRQVKDELKIVRGGRVDDN